MSGRTGTHDISSLLATRNQSAAAFGMDTIAEVVARDLEAHNTLMRDAVSEFAEITVDRQRISGASPAGEMKKVDEYGRAPTQKPAQNAQVGFPLDKFQYPIGWTKDWAEEKTPADVAQMAQNAELAHRKVILREIKRAIFLSANYQHVDDLVDNISFGVKRLANADSAAIPDGPNGETFDAATHTHYLANATLTTVFADALINTVVEHGHGGAVRVYINKAQEAAWRGLTGFSAYLDARLTLGTQANQPATRLNITRMDNRPIGIYGAAEIWVKPWVPTTYALAFDADASGKPLVIRERVAGSMNLRLVAEIDTHPLVVDFRECKFGAGVWTRTNGAVLYTGGGAYVDPTIT
jgi:hypothetical protein